MRPPADLLVGRLFFVYAYLIVYAPEFAFHTIERQILHTDIRNENNAVSVRF